MWMNATIIQKKLDAGGMSARILLSATKVFNESVRSASVYADNRHFPFYYYLGQQIQPKKAIQVGPYLGLPASCFLQSCHSVKEWICVGERSSIVESNTRLFCEGSALFLEWHSKFHEDYKADVGFLSQDFAKEEHLSHLEFLWDHLEPEGLLVSDYITSSNAFEEFCRVKNRTPIIFQTRYSVGVIQR